MKTNILKSTLAGLLIGIGACAFISVENKIIGSALFSLGLLSIFHLQANLFTGKVGMLPNKTKVTRILIMLIFNFIGISLIALMMRVNINMVEKCSQISLNKLDKSFWEALINAIFCGVLIQLAVDMKKSGAISTILCIMVFILCGFEHCVANIFYFVCGDILTLKAILYVLVYICGNTIGGIGMRLLIERSQL